MKRVALLARIPDRLAHLPSTSSQIFLSTRRNHAEAVLSRHDLALINRGDFTGVKPSNMKPERENLPDNVIAKLQEQVTRNSRISGENFMKGILLPLEAGVSQPNGFAEAFKRSSDRFGPFALSLCGKVMPDIPSDQRAILMGRLWTTYEKLNIPITRAVFNQRLAIWVENSHDFDPLETLNDMELKYQLEPDVTTFNLLLKRLAFSEKIGNIEKWTLKMAERGVLPNMETECMKVMCNATARRYDATDEAITSALIKHGEPARSKAMGAALIGTVIARDMERLRSLLRQAVIVFKSEKHVLGVEYKDIFDVIWFLAKNSIGDDGKQFAGLTEEILDRVKHTQGFFKHLIREVERHIAHGYYYSAGALIVDVLRVNKMMQRQQKNTVYDHILPKICRQLIRQKADPDVIKEVSDRISAGFQHQYRIYDHVVFSLLTYRGYSPHDKFEMLAKFVDVIDSERERIHITLPLLTCCDDVDENMKMLYRITKLLGYQDLSLLDVGVMSKRILIPLLNRQRYEPDYVKRLDTLARVLKSYGVSEEVSYKLVLNWWNYLKVDKRSDRHQQEEIRTWLEHNWDQIWIKEKPLPGPVLSFENLQALIDQGSNERVHSEIVKHGWPKNTNFKTLAPQIIDLYLKSADWGSTTKMLNMLSSACNKDTGPETGPEDYPVKNVHLIQIMLRKVFDSPTLEVSSIVDFAYELRRMFPYATTENSTYVETLNASNKLFGSILLNKKRAELTADRVDRVIDLLVTMIRMDMLSLLINETLTSKIISSVLSSLGWNAAVETWMKFQSKLYLSNGMLALLKYSISYSQNRDHTQFVLHKSKTYLSQSRSNAIYVAALMTVGKETEAEQFLKTITHQIRPVDAMHVFRLLNAFNFRTHDHQSTTAFARLCLQYTDLKNDETACALFHDDWLRVCEQNKLGQLPLELYDLFKSYGRDLSQEQKRRVFDLATKHKSLAQKWIFDQEGPYHLLNVTEESRKQFISEFEDRLQRLEEELKDPETKRLVPELDESKLLGNILNLQLHDELLLNPEISNEEVDKMLEGIAS